MIRTSRPGLQATSAEISNTETLENTRLQPSCWLAKNKRYSLASSKVNIPSPQLLYRSNNTARQYSSIQQDSTSQSSFVQQTATKQAFVSQHSSTQEGFISQHSLMQEATISHPLEDITACSQEPLRASDLANATPQERKLMLGERVYPQVKKFYPELASKITGMILEINNNDLLQILENPNLVKKKAR
ncbi:Maternally expressed PAB C-terminal protein [Armadillidium nasatum]|uniref:Maternally expressed PAB C-terminal protein n=1 Tax=Armadillidium nasatum TaxID=96803 RepID=A0A5N5SU80_9CRUS|nr:Maternally expressed PAB C-terminal protein [Armadillidium nasatum]